MIFSLEVLRVHKCQNIWHEIIRSGKIYGDSVDVPNEIAASILNRCGDALNAIQSITVPPQPNRPSPPLHIPLSEWPIAFRALSLLATDADTGLGDVIERIVGPIGGNAFKAWYKAATGKDCGCGQRKDWLNQRYPLKSIDLAPLA